MAEATITVREYIGSLASVDLLGTNTLLLNAFGLPENGQLVDNDGTLETGDNGVATFDGNALTYIGSGMIQPNLLGGGLGPAVAVVAFESGGEVFFTFPEGPPNFLTALSMELTLTTDPGDVFTPVCFAAGTMIKVPNGYATVEQLIAGDEVVDHRGRVHTVRWVGARRLKIPRGLHPVFHKWLPVVIPASSFGPGLPFADLVVSQQHRILLEGHEVEVLTGELQALAPAKALTGQRIRVDERVTSISYHHILCDQHVVLLANGVPAESMYTGDQVGRNWAEIAYLFPEEFEDRRRGMRAAAPFLRAYEARAVMRSIEARLLEAADDERVTYLRNHRGQPRPKRGAGDRVTARKYRAFGKG